MNHDPRFQQAFEKHLPIKAVPYCLSLWKETPFSFHITKERMTKLGDFRYRSNQKIQTITINYNLNPYQFLITYIHEVAHLRTFAKYGLNIKPHGTEWKRSFQELMSPLLTHEVFPTEILIPLRRHMINPKASSSADLWLMMEVKKFDKKSTSKNKFYLNQIKSGNKFELRGRVFEKLELRRTRVLCLEVSSGKKFLISSHAEVKLL
ncbi:SprT-like domain-containing protein [Belliella kenyensis]|uniref:SprT-like domain-containing protein n=1 Tax=Belliella kenyensis TaxID=1472724 RepID=A0ABV8ENY5_9BACT|nr:SprT-like domain-containing protein [Belliella kenyensis]MCH7401458.1 SprT-like domain-containing protein [Belliella kenyensis]MDN3603261.1 SprT-like domain-containing protein [Belliella kenyensis]